MTATPAAAEIRVAACVVHWRAPELVPEVVERLFRSDRIHAWVVVVDNASGRADLETLRARLDPRTELLALPENVGFAAAANAGLRHMLGDPAIEFVLVCAHDALVEPDTVRRLVEALRESEDLGIVGPTVEHADGTRTGPHRYRDEPGVRRAPSLPGGVEPSDWLSGALLVMRPACLSETGFFDERLFAYCEDVDLCLRARRAGWSVGLVRDAVVREQGSTIGSAGHIYLISRNSLLIARWRGSRPAVLARAARLASSCARAYVGSILPTRTSEQRHRSRAFAMGQGRALVDGLRGRHGPPPSPLLRREREDVVASVASESPTVHSVSVVIPTWRRAGYLERALVAVAAQEPAPTEILVVGRDEDEDAREVAERAGGVVRWVGGAEPGHVRPVRRGLAEAASDVVVFLDDDAEPEPGWLAPLLGPFADPRVACVGGGVITPGWHGIVHEDAGRIRWYGKHVGNVGALEADRLVDVDAVMEGNWAWRAEVLRSLRFDPRLDVDDAPMYGLDLCLQAKERGWRVVYRSAARVTHHAAPRESATDRDDRVPRITAYARNYTIIALERFRGLRRVAFVPWWWLIGEGDNYGALGMLYGFLRRRPRVWAMTVAGTRGRWQGVGAWRRGR